MSFELDQFHDAFFEESLEAIDGMENALLKLDVGAPEPELINTIFRVAHSIKGGSGMFGFNEITSFTHTLETLLDGLRSARFEVTQEISDLLLKAVDVLREMLQAVQSKQPLDQQRVSDLQFDLEMLVAQKVKGAASSPEPLGAAPPSPPPGQQPSIQVTKTVQSAQVEGWRIGFVPGPQLLIRGNDPLRMFAELAELGTVETEADWSQLPDLKQLDPEVCALQWRLQLASEVTRPVVEEIFEWAERDCDITIEALANQQADVPATMDKLAPTAPVVETDSQGPGSKRVAKPDAPKAAAGASGSASSDATSIRVSIDKIDELLNIVGEVVITQSMLAQIGDAVEGPSSERLRFGLSQLERHVRELQESVMRIRMLPISFVFSRFPRLVRDLSQQLGKQVALKMTGEHTELDKTVMEKIGDPLVHLVRNSVDHGIEQSEVRLAQGKPGVGSVYLNAYHQGGAIIIEVSDDGAGLNKERILAKAKERGLIGATDMLSDEMIHDLMFMPGFSTADKTTDISGRGVGMDVVRRNIAELGGTIEVRSVDGKGSKFKITLPLTLAIVDGQSVAVGEEIYIVPLVSIVVSLQLKPEAANYLVGRGEVFSFRGEYVPIVRLHKLFGAKGRSESLHEGLIMVVEGDGRKVGLFVDDLLGQQQVVIKSLESNYGRVDGVSGATILGEGTVALILDVPGLIRVADETLQAA